ncbi:hypothetical protein [Candidatus Kuenenia stuttgartiensis]|uniref:hypothetical protein n=1 Tax=Kuenenia stuttgartiensis TaxID=174633 RepID=UPI00146DA530|nr:hypothetical protein [Candidatus Kuenenia stuttgartiensis]
MPAGYTQMMIGLSFGIGPAYEIIIAGNPRAVDTRDMLNTLRRHFIPNKIVLLRPTDEETPEITRIAKFTEHQSGIDGKATAYICRDTHVRCL